MLIVHHYFQWPKKSNSTKKAKYEEYTSKQVLFRKTEMHQEKALPFLIESPLLTTVQVRLETVQVRLETKKVLVSSILRLPYLHPRKKKIFSVLIIISLFGSPQLLNWLIIEHSSSTVVPQLFRIFFTTETICRFGACSVPLENEGLFTKLINEGSLFTKYDKRLLELSNSALSLGQLHYFLS
jgi:hypothetical protein